MEEKGVREEGEGVSEDSGSRRAQRIEAENQEKMELHV